MIEDAVRGAIGPEPYVFFLTEDEYRILTVAYRTDLDPQSQAEAFNAELREVVFAAVEGFVRAESEPLAMIVMAWPFGQLEGQSALVQIGVELSTAQRWYSGDLSADSFVDSWLTAADLGLDQ